MHHEINLNFNRKDFEAVYFADQNRSLIAGPTTKRHFLYFIIALSLFIVSGFYYWPDEMGAFFYISAIVLAYTLNKYYVVFKNVSKWTQQVNTYLNNLEKYKSQRLVLTDEALTQIQDDEELVENWSDFITAEIKDTHILLVSEVNFIFPAKSMSAQDYQLFKTVVSAKIPPKKG